jgi:hypothetical protein
MQRTALAMFGIWLLGAGLAAAQDLPDGTFASTSEGCTELESKTPAELGKDLDFYVFTKKGVGAYRQTCDFVTVTPHSSSSWAATAFCDESGYVYPDLFAIAQKENGDLGITRLTDLTQQEANDAAAEDPSAIPGDMNPSEVDRDDQAEAGDSQPPHEGADAEPEGGADAFNTYVRCGNVKQ